MFIGFWSATLKETPIPSGSNMFLKKKELVLGNLNAKRDWGYAPEYVEAMWLMLQHKEPLDLVIATGETHSVRELIEKAFKIAGYNIYWEGES